LRYFCTVLINCYFNYYFVSVEAATQAAAFAFALFLKGGLKSLILKYKVYGLVMFDENFVILPY